MRPKRRGGTSRLSPYGTVAIKVGKSSSPTGADQWPHSPLPVVELVIALTSGKGPDDLMFTSPDGEPIRLPNWRVGLLRMPVCPGWLHTIFGTPRPR
ncbi:hypothetical protein GCM10009841_35120 [Microlunatus panaciterrae]